jgi:long-chain acyl-CoA synthetase
MLVGDAVRRGAASSPDRPAISRGAAFVTYGSLAARIEGIAGTLQREHAAFEGTTIPIVALLLDDSIEFLAGFLSVVRAGAIAAPLSTAWPPAQLARVRDAAQPIALIDHAALEALDDTAGAPRAVSRGPEVPFYAGFTSGSTGEPRGIVRSHAAWLRSFDAMSTAFGVPDGARVLVPGSLFFSFSLIAALHTLHTGGTLLVPDHEGPRGLAAALAEGADAVHVLPSVLHETLALADRRGQTFADVRRIICAGEPLSAETRALVAARCPRAELFEYYGASELGFVTLLDPAGAAAHPGSVGRPFPGSEVAVLDDEGRPLPPGETGLLCARTPYGGMRTLDGDDLDVTLDHHGWRTVGDLASRDVEGYVTLSGRGDRMAVIRGENVYPEEIERVIAGLPGVARVAVLPLPAATPTHLVAAVQVDGEGPNADAILEACRAALPPRKRPRRLVLVESMALTGTGKIDYGQMRDVITD